MKTPTDTERLDWLDRVKPLTFHDSPAPWEFVNPDWSGEGKTLREAIDAAMEDERRRP